MKFFIIFKNLSQHMIFVNISQQKVNTRSTYGEYHPTYQNVQNFIKKMNWVNIWFFGQQKATLCQHHPAYQNLQNFVKNGTLFKIWSFTQPKIHFSKWSSQIWLVGWENSNIKFFQRISSNYKNIYKVFQNPFLDMVFSNMVGWVGEVKYQVCSKDFIKIQIISSFSKSIFRHCLLKYGWVGGRSKISSFIKRFYQNTAYVKFFQNYFFEMVFSNMVGWVGEFKYQVFSKDFTKLQNI